jgi:cellulose synthase/poly-beta-1,6-N-acetylglucosamine synthase-like glycosyltransferase
MIKLSILIPTLVRREALFQKVYNELTRQRLELDKPTQVEIIFYRDTGKVSIGAKRNLLIKEAQGEYVCFVDDDDMVSPDYIRTILNGLKDNPDTVQLNGRITTNGLNPKRFEHSIKYVKYAEINGVYQRPPNHLNPIKKELVQDILFKEVNFGEDTDWALRVLATKRIKTEYSHTNLLYYYNFVPKKVY